MELGTRQFEFLQRHGEDEEKEEEVETPQVAGQWHQKSKKSIRAITFTPEERSSGSKSWIDSRYSSNKVSNS